MDWNKSVSEEEWHKICETPLRSSNSLGLLLKNIFPDAENIKVGCNYIYFDLYGFSCGLPTSRCNGVYIKTNWYKKDNGQPSNPYWGNDVKMKKYFEAKDRGDNWDILFKYRIPDLTSYKKWVRFILWFGYYRWKSDHREEWETKFASEELYFEERVKAYHEERKNIHDKAVTMKNILITELKKFSDKIYTFDGDWYKVDDIIRWEGLENK